MRYYQLSFFLSIIFLGCKTNTGDIIYTSDAYSIFADRVVQGNFEARALSATHMTSNYESPANAFQDANVTFKFSINGKDNEMLPGVDHHLTIEAINGKSVSPVITFGSTNHNWTTEGEYLQPETEWTVKLDMGPVLKQFAEAGFFTTPNGDKIYKEDFKAVYIAGNTLPMTWDFDNLKNRPELELKDPDGDGIFETTLMLNSKSDIKKIDSVWKLTKDISAFPQYQSPHVIADAIYNMSLEEMEKAVEKDSTLRTGAEWAGVWTRDVSYSIILSMAYMQPQVAKNSLRRKVNKRKRIIQDTGTGGAWPVSTDRMIWAVAAWEIYLATGDVDWMKEAYEIIKLSLEDDYKVCYDKETGMVKGESSFLDWREQTYPKDFGSSLIFESECLGTNAAHYQANRVAAKMAGLVGDALMAQRFETMAEKIKSGMNTYLWQEEKGFYGQYIYGQFYKPLSTKSEALGEALSVLFDVADEERQKRIVSSTPVVDFGISCIYPQIPGIPPYHNNGIWPFVQSFWLLAGAKVGNELSVMESIAAIYRPSALFLTNKENFVAENGDFSGTVINSSNMLWSLSGNIGLVHKVLFGIRFTEDGLTFKPVVPAALQGERQLSNFIYRNAVLNIKVSGYGDQMESIMLDGVPLKDNLIPTTLTGQHEVSISMNNGFSGLGKINKVENHFSPEMPYPGFETTPDSKDVTYRWYTPKNAVAYEVFRNGKFYKNSKDTLITMDSTDLHKYHVRAVDEKGETSFFSHIIYRTIKSHSGDRNYQFVEAERFAPLSSFAAKGYNGDGFIEISRTKNWMVDFQVEIKEPGLYAIAFKYANGNGPINTENKCAIRSIYINDSLMGATVFPQLGTNEWSAWGLTNSIQYRFMPGKQIISLRFEDWNENMNGEINQALIDYITLVLLEK
jgi:hypothetical protein